MAVVADLDILDLVIEPHEDTPEGREAFRRAVQSLRDREADARVSEEIGHWLAQRREAQKRPPCS